MSLAAAYFEGLSTQRSPKVDYIQEKNSPLSLSPLQQYRSSARIAIAKKVPIRSILISHPKLRPAPVHRQKRWCPKVLSRGCQLGVVATKMRSLYYRRARDTKFSPPDRDERGLGIILYNLLRGRRRDDGELLWTVAIVIRAGCVITVVRLPIQNGQKGDIFQFPFSGAEMITSQSQNATAAGSRA